MRIAYLDCIGGLSGDMILGSFLAAGLDPDVLRKELKKLNLSGWDLSVGKVDKRGLTATKVDVSVTAEPVDRTLLDILKIIAGSKLRSGPKHDAARVFEILATAEAAAHNKVPATVHFHEVGAIDAIIDICGAAVCLDIMGIDKLYASPLTISRPAPATLEILKNRSVTVEDRGLENVTPTGAAIVTALAERGSPPLPVIIRRVGYGAGAADTDIPNVARLWLADTDDTTVSANDYVMLLESNIDDLSPEELSFAMERMFEAGALDVWFTPIIMKKGRPAYLVSCLCEPGRDKKLVDSFFRETGTLGIRVSSVSRRALNRDTVKAKTRYGEIRVKIGWYDGAAVSARPEFEDVAAAARQHDQPFRDVYKAALKNLPSR